MISKDIWLCFIPIFLFLILVMRIYGEYCEDKIMKRIEKLEKEVKELKEKNNE